MAGEFKIKSGLLLGPAPTQPVISITDASTSITYDASSLLATGKAVYDFVNAELANAGGDASLVGLTDTSIASEASNDVISFDGDKWSNRQDYWSIDISTLDEEALTPSDPSIKVLLSTIEIEKNGGEVTLIEMEVTSDASVDTPMAYGFNIDSIEIAQVY